MKSSSVSDRNARPGTGFALVLLGAVLLLMSRVQLVSQDEPSTEKNQINHRKLIESWNAERGRDVYKTSCASCHGNMEDGARNPNARVLWEGEFKNGADPYSMYQTLTHGYQQMPSMDWLSPRERYNVIHYIRKTFIKPENPDQFVPVDDAYLSSLPDGETTGTATAPRTTQAFDTGLHYRIGEARSALAWQVGAKVSLSYDLHRMGLEAVWKGDFLDLGDSFFEKKRGEGRPQPTGRPLPGMDRWQWALNGSFNVDPKQYDEWPDRGPAPESWMKYHGRYVHGDRMVLRYEISDRMVFEQPAAEQQGIVTVLKHTLEIAPGNEPLKLSVGGAENANIHRSGMYTLDGERTDRSRTHAGERMAMISGAWGGSTAHQKPFKNAVVAGVAGETDGLDWEIDQDGRRIVLHIPGDEERRTLQVVRSAVGNRSQVQQFSRLVRRADDGEPIPRPSRLTEGGPEQWTETVTVETQPGEAKNGYALDRVPVPFDNPYGVWMRTSTLDFFPDGRAAVATFTGDVWIVSGLGADQDEVTWSRFASGLYEPLGLKVHDGHVYVTTRSGIRRLHDLNEDGEADYYEVFYADPDVRTNWHMFNLNLEVGPKGHFYYSRAGIFNMFDPPPGGVVRVEPDGSDGEVIATGFRGPNGMGLLPDGRLLVSDNQGQWIPTSKINIIKEDHFYGYPPGQAAAVGTQKYDPRDEFTEPLIWIPYSEDRSSGGQLWIEDDFGPLSNRLLHTSFDPGKLFYVLMDQREQDVNAGMVVPLPYQFDTGVHRARRHPGTGNVWLVGLSGWAHEADFNDGGLYRLRPSGQDALVVDGFEIREDAIRLTFNRALDLDSASQSGNYTLKQWNYKYMERYGSPRYSVSNPDEEGEDPVPVSSVRLSENRRSVTLEVDELQPVDQMHVQVDVKDAGGESFSRDLYLTIHNVPGDAKEEER